MPSGGPRAGSGHPGHWVILKVDGCNWIALGPGSWKGWAPIVCGHIHHSAQTARDCALATWPRAHELDYTSVRAGRDRGTDPLPQQAAQDHPRRKPSKG